jgi:hypothetical protein
MSHQRVPPGCALAIAAAVASLVSVSLAGQAPTSGTRTAAAAKTTAAPNTKTTAASKTWTAKTAWGEPDLQGIWSYASLTPLERPAALAGREFFTPEEAAAREASAGADSPPPPGDPGAYNALWFDRGKIASNLRTSLIVDPPDGRLPLTADGLKRKAAQAELDRVHAADSWLDLPAWDRCITYHGVPPISTGYNNTYQIVQAPGSVAILSENIHDVRIIPLDGRPHLAANIGQWNGDSRGHWEGNTLVVETTNYSDKTELRFPSSRNTHAVERFTRVNENLIDYQFTIVDPTMYTRPWTAVRPMPRLANYQIFEYACHEGNYALSHILSQARAQEKAAQETARKTATK